MESYNKKPSDYNPDKLFGRDYRLWKEWKGVDDLCAKRIADSPDPSKPSIEYRIKKRDTQGFPVEYEIWYRVKSIIGLKENSTLREPVFGYLHKMSIVLPNNYPSADGNPIFTFLTDIWHPNIRYSGNFKGHVCLNSKGMGVLSSLSILVVRVEHYLKYLEYHAENTPPYPEDQTVAQWVREEGEPNGWIPFKQNDGDETEPEPEPKPVEPQPTPAPIEPIPTTPQKKFRI